VTVIDDREAYANSERFPDARRPWLMIRFGGEKAGDGGFFVHRDRDARTQRRHAHPAMGGERAAPVPGHDRFGKKVHFGAKRSWKRKESREKS